MGAEQPPKRRVHRKKAGAAKAAELAIEARREKAVKLKVSGWAYRDIAAHLKCSVGTVCSDINAVLDRVKETADDRARRERAMSLARLDVATKGIWPSVENGDLEAVDRLVKLEARRAKVEGLDAPQGFELGGPGWAPIAIDARSQLLERLAGLIDREAQPGGASEDPSKPNAR